MSRLFYIVTFYALTLTKELKAQDITKTIIIKGTRHTAHLDFSGFYVFDNKPDTILNISTNHFANFEFNDFNKDGYKDIFFDWGGNMPNRFSLYLFIPSIERFKEIKKFSDFPDATPIKGTKYYYSYHKAGCADNTWYSDLFYIKNYTAIKIGTIYGDGCGINDGIYINKVSQGKKTLIKTLPLITIDTYKDHKWGFIKQYWMKNYSKFM